MEAFEAQGEWWLPDRPDARVAGTLVVDENGAAELRLIGALRDHLEAGESVTENGVTTTTFTEASMQAAGVYPRILGLVGSEAYTLDDCFQVHRSVGIFGAGIGAERVHVHYVLKGLHLEEDKGLEFQSIVVHLDWLAYWVLKSGIEETFNFTENEDGTIKPVSHTLTVRPLERQEFEGPNGASITLGQIYGIHGDAVVEKRVSQDFYFAVEYPALRPLGEMLSCASALQDLVSMGTGRVAAFSSVVLRHPDVVFRIATDKNHLTEIELFARWQVQGAAAKKSLMKHDMLFTLSDIGGVEGAARWLVIADRYRSALSRVMGTRYSRATFAADNLLSCAAALEAYDRDKHGDDIYFVDRLKRCIGTAGGLFSDLVGDSEAWAKAVKDNRNWVAHHLASIEGASSAQFFLSRSAYWLFMICLLRDAGAPEEVFASMKEHSTYRSLRVQLPEVLAP